MEDSSPDLSLKLGRGSSGSRDSYYMDFAQGIDSDIEEITTIVAPTKPIETLEPNEVDGSDKNISAPDSESARIEMT